MAGCQARSNADRMSSLRSAVASPTTLSFSSWIFSASNALSVLACFLNPCGLRGTREMKIVHGIEIVPGGFSPYPSLGLTGE